MARKGETLSAETKAKITGRPVSDSTNPSTVHQWLKKHHPKAGMCDECGKEGRTDYAYLHHPNAHTRDRADYRELCRRCHRAMDDAIYKWSEQLAHVGASLTTEQRSEFGKRGALARWGG